MTATTSIATSRPIINLAGVSKSFGATQVLKEINRGPETRQ